MHQGQQKEQTTDIDTYKMSDIRFIGTALVVQWLRLFFHCTGPCFDPWSGNKDPTCGAATHAQNNPAFIKGIKGNIEKKISKFLVLRLSKMIS